MRSPLSVRLFCSSTGGFWPIRNELILNDNALPIVRNNGWLLNSAATRPEATPRRR
jgi:hypothetical protein